MNRCRRCTRLALAAALAVSALSPATAHAADLTWTALGGYQQGAGLRVQGTLARLTPVVPLAVQFGFGYAIVDPGKAELARRMDYQSQIYRGLMKIALDNPNAPSYTTWDLTDRYSWVIMPTGGVPGYGYADLLYADYSPKPAYKAVLEELKNY